MGSPEPPAEKQGFEGLLGSSPVRTTLPAAHTPQQNGTPGAQSVSVSSPVAGAGRWDQCHSSPSSWGTPGKSFQSLSQRGQASPGSAGTSPGLGQRSPGISGKGSPEQGAGRGRGRGGGPGRGYTGKGWPPKKRPDGTPGAEGKTADGEPVEAACPRAKDEIFEELKKVLEGNSALQFSHFDARVRQHLHALHHAGGRARVREALGMVHNATMQKTRGDVKNWPAYLLTLLKKFDADQGSQDREARARQRIAAAAEKTSPGKSSSEDGADALDLSPEKAPFWEEDENEVVPAPTKTISAGSWVRSAAAVAVAGLAAAAWGTAMPDDAATASSVRMPAPAVPPPPSLPPPGPPSRGANAALRQPLTAPPSSAPQLAAASKMPGPPPSAPPMLAHAPPTAPPSGPPRNIPNLAAGVQQVFGTAPHFQGGTPDIVTRPPPPWAKQPPPAAPAAVAAR